MTSAAVHAPLTAAERLDLADAIRAGDPLAEQLVDALDVEQVRAAVSRTAPRVRRDEAVLERRILLALGAMPDVLCMRNEVGVGLRASLLPELCPPCRATSRRFRIAFGAGGKGAPDLLLSVAGRAAGVELKSDTGRVSPEQLAWHKAATRRGMYVAVVRKLDEALAVVSALRSGART